MLKKRVSCRRLPEGCPPPYYTAQYVGEPLVNADRYTDCLVRLPLYYDLPIALIFFATPDMLSGLCTWAFYDNNDSDAVTTQFASGCASIITFAVDENRSGGRRCFLGMLDPSARPLVPANELTFTIPMSRFKEMLTTMNDSALYQKAFSALKRRINKQEKFEL